MSPRPTSSCCRFVERLDAAFSARATLDQPARRPASATRELPRTRAFRWWRVRGNDNTVRIGGAILHCRRPMVARGPAGRRLEVELHLDGRLFVMDHDRTLLVLPVSPDPDDLRGITHQAGLVRRRHRTPPSGPATRPGPINHGADLPSQPRIPA